MGIPVSVLEIDIGSYSVIEATVINPHNFYVVSDLCLQAPQAFEIINNNYKLRLMGPETRETVYWIVKIPIDMERGILTAFPTNFLSSRNASSSVEFRVTEGQGYPKYSFEWLKDAVKKESMSAL